MQERNRKGRAWNCPVAPLVRIEVHRKDYLALAELLTEHGTRDIFFSDGGIWLPMADDDALKALQAYFAASSPGAQQMDP